MKLFDIKCILIPFALMLISIPSYGQSRNIFYDEYLSTSFEGENWLSVPYIFTHILPNDGSIVIREKVRGAKNQIGLYDKTYFYNSKLDSVVVTRKFLTLRSIEKFLFYYEDLNKGSYVIMKYDGSNWAVTDSGRFKMKPMALKQLLSNEFPKTELYDTIAFVKSSITNLTHGFTVSNKYVTYFINNSEIYKSTIENNYITFVNYVNSYKWEACLYDKKRLVVRCFRRSGIGNTTDFDLIWQTTTYYREKSGRAKKTVVDIGSFSPKHIMTLKKKKKYFKK